MMTALAAVAEDHLKQTRNLGENESNPLKHQGTNGDLWSTKQTGSHHETQHLGY